MSIIAARGRIWLSGHTLIGPPGDGHSIRDASGVFPMCGPGPRGDAVAMNTATANPQATTDPSSEVRQDTRPESQPQPLYRPLDDRMLAGVASGAARYLHVDVTVMRIILVALVIFGGIGVPLYLAAWLLIPEEGADQSIASEAIQSLQARAR